MLLSCLIQVRLSRGLTQLFLALALASCAASTSIAPPVPPPAVEETAAPSATDPAAPVETVALVEAVEPLTLVDNLEHPWGMVWLPDGAMLITERPGRVRLVRDGQLDPTPVAGVPAVLAQGQGGLLDIALHPDFAENRWVYFTYASGSSTANQTRVARARFDGQALGDWTVIFEVDRAKEGGQHFGSRLLWLPDNTLLVSVGDGGNPPVTLDGELIRNQAQNLQARLGKVIRITEDGSVPADNPLTNSPNADPLIWSYGHRNIQGLALDGETNQIWATEHGSRGGDELNQLQPGENYGWPLVTHSEEYSGGPISAERSRPGLIDPKQVWTPAIAPSGLAVYRGNRYPQWQGQLFAGGLVSQSVQRLEVNAEGAVVNQTEIAIGQRVRDVKQGPDGFLYVLTDQPNGRLIRLEPLPSS